MNLNHRRYPPVLLSFCLFRENASSSMCKQTRDAGLLTILSTRYIKKLTSALYVETGLSLSNTLKLDVKKFTIDKK